MTVEKFDPKQTTTLEGPKAVLKQQSEMTNSSDTAKAKMSIMESCGISVVESPAEIGVTMKKILI